jgi:hypothetical protein
MKGIVVLLFSWILLVSAATINSCSENAGARQSVTADDSILTEVQSPVVSDQFKNYWYAGQAEISSYKLRQARYGEIHDGTAVLIFVTEDFSKSKQVKLDRPENAGNDKLPVLKLNLTKKFVTGIYPYSMMMSAFSPVDIVNDPHAVKVSASVQEWCGNTFTQINRRNGNFEMQWFSYFEDEGDQKIHFTTSYLEDELWNLIRLDPNRLPQGKQLVLPGSLYTRLTHISPKPQPATLSLEKNGDHFRYVIQYDQPDHSLAIEFSKDFPFQITGWSEKFAGFDGKVLETTATLDRSIMNSYWQHHANADRSLRGQLDLPRDWQ